MTVIGLDLSLTAPGWFRREPSGRITHGTWSPGDAKGIQRMHTICRRVVDLLPGVSVGAEEMKQTLVVIEGFSHNSTSSSLDQIHGLGWIVRYALWYRNVPFVEVAPNALKKFATGNGSSSKAKKDGTHAATKEVVIREVYKRWGVNVGDNNEADAYVLGRIGMHLAGLDAAESLTAFQHEVIRGLKAA